MKARRTLALFVTVLFMGGFFYSEASLQTGSQSSGSSKTTEPNKEIAELQKQISGRETKPAEEVFKNIRILKGFQAARVLRIMNMFTRVIGVDCTHCHVSGEWDKDDRQPKQTARKMWNVMAQVNGSLKEAIGKGTVNCYTCHRGQTMPALNPPS